MKSPWRALAVLLFGLCAAQWLHAAPFAYVTHQSGVTVIDLGIRATVAELAANGAVGVAVNPDVNRVYVSGSGRVSVIDMRAQQVVATVSDSAGPGPIVLRPARPEAFLVPGLCPPAPIMAPCNSGPTTIQVLNTDNNTISDSFADQATARVAFSADGVLMFVTRIAPASVSILNASTRQNLTTIALASSPMGMALDASRNLLYVAEAGGNSVAIIDVAARVLAGRIPVGSGPIEMVLKGGRLFVTNSGSNNVSVIDATSRTVVGTVAVGARPVGIDATPGGDVVVVANNGGNSISLIDTLTLNVVATLGTGPAPQAIGRFIAGSSPPVPPDALSGLWFNPSEPGWGVHVSHRGNKIFAAWFTYNSSGAPKWYVSSDCSMNSQLPTPPATGEATCSGNLYETTGPRFFSDPYNPGAVVVRKLGLFQMGFTDRNNGAMSVVTDNAVKTFTLKRQVFAAGGVPGADYTDLWWNPSESGWGIGITQQASTMFLAWFAYDDTGTPVWYVASNCAVNGAGNACTGDLYRTTGPADPLHNAFDPSRVTVVKVGTITASFGDANSGTLSYTIDGRAGTKSIVRQLF